MNAINYSKPETEDIHVEATCRWHKAYVAVGSNLGDSKAYIDRGIDVLKADKNIRILKQSELIRTKPYGGIDQPDFLNGMIIIETVYEPLELLHVLNKTEALCDRERTLRWGPRTLDLDIIYYDDVIMDSHELTIPHVDMQNREFVLKPLAEVDAFVTHPVSGLKAEEMLANLAG